MAKRQFSLTSDEHSPAKSARRDREPGPNVVTRSRKAIAEKSPYKPLDPGQIRLIVLEAGVRDDAIRGELRIVSVDENPTYTALSYCWGVPTKIRGVNVRGEQLLVTENLYVALRYLRREDADVVLWVDALCINQDDFEERSQQVSIMDKIFSRSTSVIAFVDQPQEDTATGVNLLRELASKQKSAPHLDQFVKDVIDAAKSDTYIRPWHTLGHLFECSYWRRIWVIQELALNSENTFVYFGKHHLPLTEFTAGCWTWASLLRDLPYDSIDMMTWSLGWSWQYIWPMMRFIKNWSNLALTGAIELTFDFDAWDKKDYVYSLLSLANAYERQLIIPKYDQTYEQFRVEIARLLLDSSSDLKCLRGNRYDPADVYYIEPSWALPLPLEFEGRSDSSDLNWQVLRHACGQKARTLKYSQDHKYLSLRGVHFDTVKSVEGPFSSYPSLSPDCMKRIAALVGSLKMRPRLWRVLVMDSWWDADPLCDASAAKKIKIPAPETYGIGFDELFGYRRSERLSLVKPENSNKAQSLRRQINRLELSDRCFFVTESGRMGIGPRATKTGDAVVIFYGAGYCHMLRQQDTQFILLGDAWVDGVMEGQFMDSPECAERERWFELR